MEKEALRAQWAISLRNRLGGRRLHFTNLLGASPPQALRVSALPLTRSVPWAFPCGVVLRPVPTLTF